MKKVEMITKTNKNIMKIIRIASMVVITSVFIISCGQSAMNEVMLEEAEEKTTTEEAGLPDTNRSEPGLATNFDVNTKAPANKKFIKTTDLKFKVRNVLFATEKIEDLTSRFGGYTIYSNLQNRNDNTKRTNVSRDSILNSSQITVVNNIQLKIPTENLDSFIRQLSPIVVFFDYRVIKMNDVTFDLMLKSKKSERLKAYELRQVKHIDSKNARLKETTVAEDNLLDKQLTADNEQIALQQLEDNIAYSTVNIDIYQNSLIITNTEPDFSYVSELKPNIFKRIADSIIQGWQILEEIIIFLVRIWGIILLIIVVIAVFKYLPGIVKRIINSIIHRH